MKLGSMRLLIVSLAFAGSGAFLCLRAQDASAAPSSEVDQCVKWMKATVPLQLMDDLDPAGFCSGTYRGPTGGWYSIQHCEQPLEQLTGAPLRYCTSSGQINPREAWAAGFSSPTKYGSDLLDGTSDSAEGSRRNAATFYSRTAVWMENLRVPAGMYKLIPSKSTEGWSLTVAKQDGERRGAEPQPQYLGSVKMKSSAAGNPTGKPSLLVSTSPWAEGCPGPEPDFNVRELHFVYGSTNLFVCIRPDQVLQNQEANINGW